MGDPFFSILKKGATNPLFSKGIVKVSPLLTPPPDWKSKGRFIPPPLKSINIFLFLKPKEVREARVPLKLSFSNELKRPSFPFPREDE